MNTPSEHGPENASHCSKENGCYDAIGHPWPYPCVCIYADQKGQPRKYGVIENSPE
jgi:hypothetical protein